MDLLWRHWQSFSHLLMWRSLTSRLAEFQHIVYRFPWLKLMFLEVCTEWFWGLHRVQSPSPFFGAGRTRSYRRYTEITRQGQAGVRYIYTYFSCKSCWMICPVINWCTSSVYYCGASVARLTWVGWRGGCSDLTPAPYARHTSALRQVNVARGADKEIF